MFSRLALSVVALALLGLPSSHVRGASDLRGVLTWAIADDFSHARSTRTLVLETPTGALDVAFAGAPPEDLVGHNVVINAPDQATSRADGALMLTRSMLTDAGPAADMSSGNHRVAVILFNWRDLTFQPFTRAFAQNTVFNIVAHYYNEVSWGQLTISGGNSDVYGWYTLPMNQGKTCDREAWASAAERAAAADGFVSASYDNVIYAGADGNGCQWGGIALMPGKRSWVNGSNMNYAVIGHELGHNFGTLHASTIACTENGLRVALMADASACVRGEYGDLFSIMGGANDHHQTGFAKSTSFGWIDPAEIMTATTSGDYTITPVELADGTPVVRVARGTTGTWLTLEYRQPYGTFDAFSPNAAAVNGVMVRVTGAQYESTLLIDCTPATATFDDAPCPVGSTLSDPLSGISLRIASVDTSEAVVTLTIPSSPPSPDPSSSPDPSPYLTPPVLTARENHRRYAVLDWSPSVGSGHVTVYRVFRNNKLVASVSPSRLSWRDRRPLSQRPQSYYVVAYGDQGHESAMSNTVVLYRN